MIKRASVQKMFCAGCVCFIFIYYHIISVLFHKKFFSQPFFSTKEEKHTENFLKILFFTRSIDALSTLFGYIVVIHQAQPQPTGKYLPIIKYPKIILNGGISNVSKRR